MGISAKVQKIKDHLKTVVAESLPAGLGLHPAIAAFGKALAGAIAAGGEKGKESLIRSQEPIKLFHEVVKAELIRCGVPDGLVFPPLGTSNGEVKLAGHFKFKNQDVCVVPKHLLKKPEILRTGMQDGVEEPLGFDFTQKTLAINVRSQMSSIAKNLDTMYERIFAEPLNLHMRCPELVMGELYIIPVTGFDMAAVKNGRPVFSPIITSTKSSRAKTTAQVLEQYIRAFQTVNHRNATKGEEYKYERVCLLIVDFPRDKIYHSDEELRNDGLLPPDSTTSYRGLEFSTFIPDLIRIYEERFGKGMLI
jgi:hypothetical protein